ncbi:MAG TPA: SDR family NAD(P)-dependent oxidoreductase, partial [Chthoniobacterales bacterium]
MITSENSQGDLPVAKPLLAGVRQLLTRRTPSKPATILLAGELPFPLLRLLSAEVNAAGGRLHCTLVFPTEQTLHGWRATADDTAAFDARAFCLNEEVTGFPLGALDLIAVVADEATLPHRVAVGLKPLLKKGGCLLVQSASSAGIAWQQALRRAGFRGLYARSDSVPAGMSGFEVLVCSSDGIFETNPVVAEASAAVVNRPGIAISPAGYGDTRSSPPPDPAPRVRTSGRIPVLPVIQATLAAILESMLRLTPGDLDPLAPFTDYGVDSIGGVAFVKELNRQLQIELNPTVLFNHASVEKLSTFISEQCCPSMREPEKTDGSAQRDPSPGQTTPEPPSDDRVATPAQGEVALVSPVHSARSGQPGAPTDIAVIGMSGRFPQADDVDSLWRILFAGKSAITEIPAERWDHRRVYEAGSHDANKAKSKWGGFLNDADKFDPLFFNISGREAEVMDPQQRLFLEQSYRALEDAGYAGPSTVRRCGVFAGVEPGDYLQLLMALQGQSENLPVFQGNAESILAARISYFLDLNGPSLAVNTACSSSLVAVHLACRSLLNGECDMALAGGVRVFASEKAYLALGNMGMLSPDGQCKTFDEAANGFVPGEAVAVAVLKPLVAAVRDGDHIYGVIKGSAVNQDGRTNGITAPSSVSQCAVQFEVYRKFNLDPGTFQYVEAHGTGTKLGDPIEVEALTNSFRQFTAEKQFCAIGSLKTNLGHTMAAAGICGLVKVLLCLRHGQIPASLNLRQTNPYIDFEHSPFFVNTILRPWPANSTGRRRAALSSFGFSGTNCHLVVEEHTPDRYRPNLSKPAYLFPLSAKTPEALQASVERLSLWAGEQGEAIALEDVSHTLTTGRGHFECRCVFVAGSIAEFRATLGQLARRKAVESVWWSEPAGCARPDALLRQTMAFLQRDLQAARQAGDAAYRDRLAAIAGSYAKGADLDVQCLHDGEARRRIPLPGYPFARERYWISEDGTVSSPSPDRLHPLVHRNASTLDQVQFISRFDGSEFFFADHQVRGENILPGVAYFEMVLVAARLAAGSDQFRFEGVTWLRPLTALRGREVTLRLTPKGEKTEFEVASGDDKAVHARGTFCHDGAPLPDGEEFSAIRARCPRVESPAALYGRCEAAGLALGDGLRTIREIWVGENEALARLELSSSAQKGAVGFSLHPGLLDGALQLTAVLGKGEAAGLPVPFQIDDVRFGTLGSRCYAHVVLGPQHRGLLSCEVRLQDESGRTLVHLRGVTMRVLASPGTKPGRALTYLRPVWLPKALARPGPAGIAGRLFLFSNAGSLDREIAACAPNLEIVHIRFGDDFRQDGRNVSLRPDRADDFSRLLERGQPDYVVHTWSSTSESVDDFCRRRLPSVFHLCRAQALQGMTRPVRILFVYPPETNPAHAAVSGFAQTLRQEQPAFTFKLLETERTDASRLLDELLQEELDLQVREPDGSRAIKSFEIFTPQESGRSCWRERGVYLITGAFGNIGRLFARHLAEQHQARLILLGRSKPGPESNEFAEELERFGAEVLTVQADVTDQGQVQEAVTAGKQRFQGLHGVIHAAGLISDEFLLKKSWQDFDRVLRPKVHGTLILDEATRDERLDFFALFSSISGVFGNIGQSDYAYANAFLDEFARWREQRRALGQRSGRTASINWPLWRTGSRGDGLGLEAKRMSDAGLTALDAQAGLAVFETALNTLEPQVMVLAGEADSIRKLLSPPGPTAAEPPKPRSPGHSPPGAGKPGEGTPDPDATRRALAYLTGRLARLIKLPVSRIQPNDSFEKFGIDSVMVLEFTRVLEQDFGELSKTLLFEHQTVAELAAHFVANRPDQLRRQTAPDLPEPTVALPPVPEPVPEPVASSQTQIDPEEIAIVGVFGRYPMAENLEEFWTNLRAGKDCIVEIPRERWDHRLFYDPVPGTLGKTQNKWGGFLKDIERFDAPFFSITPREAFVIDPQERIFLETVWRTVEDAGYRRSALAGKEVGVFVGVMYGEYQLYGAGDVAAGSTFPFSSSYASIANRVSYSFNWHGPSIAIDTMCSSSLTAIHLACESLRRGESELAVAGGVNATLHPHKDALLSPGGFASSEGKCRSFGEGGNGYVPGEGVGAVLLKPLAAALADHDHVYAIVKATSVNHGGKTNGYTVPNPKAQADLISTALARGRVDPGTVNYIEAHGTGTPLGDPIEITGLTRAFGAGGKPHSCAVGSVKSNIGHLESAAGIAGVTKVLLQMQHGEIVPSLHSAKLNPNIDFANSAFYVPQHVEEWKPAADGLSVRRAGVSSFGAGGANAHVMLAEFPAARAAEQNDPTIPGPFLLTLSARTEERLRAQAEQLLDHLPRLQERRTRLADVAYTLQVGREPFVERLALIIEDWEDAASKLRNFLYGAVHPDVMRGTLQTSGDDRETLLSGEEGRAFLAELIRQRKWQKLARAWVDGEEINWPEPGPGWRRLSLPGYPFAGERYWAPEKLALPSKAAESLPRLHPLIHRNVSDVGGLAFLTCLDPEEPSGTHRPLGPISLLEMGAVAARLSSPQKSWQFKDLVWGKPQDLTGPLTLLTRVVTDGTHLLVEIAVRDGAILLQGTAVPGSNLPGESLDRIRQRCLEPVLPQALAAILPRDLPAIPDPVQVFPELWRGPGELLIRFRRDPFDAHGSADCDLPPVLLQMAIEAAQLLPGGTPRSSAAPFSLKSFLISRVPAGGWCHLAGSRGPGGEQTLQITIFSDGGELNTQLHKLVLRDTGDAETSDALWLRPVWKERPAPNPVLQRGRLLLLDPTGEFETAIRTQYPDLSVFRVAPGRRYSEGDGLIEIDPTAESDYRRLVQNLRPDLIVHRWADESDTLEVALERGVFSLVHLTRALLGEPLESEKRLLFFGPRDAGPASRAVSAYAKTLALEQPRLQLRVLETDSAAACMLEEFFAPPDEREIRSQDDRREVLLFEPAEPPAEMTAPLREGGVYLVTGGLGGLGTIVAEHLAAKYRARLLLTGRTPLNEAGQNRLDQLERAGGKAHYVPGDVSSRDDAAGMVRAARERFGPLNGVIHAAGVLHDGFLLRKSLSDFAAVLAAKVHGTVLLDEMTAGEPLDFFALFSSTAGAFGNVGQSDYAYASAFLDRFADARERRRSD